MLLRRCRRKLSEKVCFRMLRGSVGICTKCCGGRGRPGAGIPVDAQMLNYSEFRIIAQMQTDEKGEVELETGYDFEIILWL